MKSPLKEAGAPHLEGPDDRMTLTQHLAELRTRIIRSVLAVVVGIIVYLIQRARGVDIGATIHEIDESPAEAQAMEALAAGMSGKTMPGAVSGMSAEGTPEGGAPMI